MTQKISIFNFSVNEGVEWRRRKGIKKKDKREESANLAFFTGFSVCPIRQETFLIVGLLHSHPLPAEIPLT